MGIPKRRAVAAPGLVLVGATAFTLAAATTAGAEGILTTAPQAAHHSVPGSDPDDTDDPKTTYVPNGNSGNTGKTGTTGIDGQVIKSDDQPGASGGYWVYVTKPTPRWEYVPPRPR